MQETLVLLTVAVRAGGGGKIALPSLTDWRVTKNFVCDYARSSIAHLNNQICCRQMCSVKVKMYQNRFRPGCAPDPTGKLTGGAYDAHPDPIFPLILTSFTLFPFLPSSPANNFGHCARVFCAIYACFP